MSHTNTRHQPAISEALKQSFQVIFSNQNEDQMILNELAKYEVPKYCAIQGGYELSINLFADLFTILGERKPTSNLAHHFFAQDCLELGAIETSDQELMAGFYLASLPTATESSTVLGYLFPQQGLKRLLLLINTPDYFEIHELPLNGPNIELVSCMHFDISVQKIIAKDLWLNESTLLLKLEAASHKAHLCIAKFQLYRSAMLLGLCQQMFTMTKQRINTRKQFGRKLIENQAIRFKLSAVFCEQKMLKNSLECLAAMIDEDAEDALAFANGVFAKTRDFMHSTFTICMQLCGAWGITKASGIEYYYRLYCLQI